MSAKAIDPSAVTKLLTTLVLMGSLFGCRGEVDEFGGSEGALSGGAGGDLGSSGASSSGDPAGGAAGGEGGIDIPLGGRSNDGSSNGILELGGASGTPDWFNDACPPSQWDCDEAERVSCGYTVPEGCGCDRSRPEVPEDCPEGEAQVCHFGTMSPDGFTFDRPLAFSCQCVPAVGSCGECEEGIGRRERTCGEKSWSGFHQIWCGCDFPLGW